MGHVGRGEPQELAREAILMCRRIARHSEDPDVTTRTFLSAPMRDVHADLMAWMRRVGMEVRIDAAGNLRGRYPAAGQARPNPHTTDTDEQATVEGIPEGILVAGFSRTLYIGSHLDTVPGAGAYDGVLGVVLGVALVEMLDGLPLPFAIEVVGFSEEEGVRFGVPFIGSRALAGVADTNLLDRRDARGQSIAEAIRDYGLDPSGIGRARATDALGYLELHIEQGPVLDTLGLPLGIVDVIAGQTRAAFDFIGKAGHAGTTPMAGRRDALAGAAEWIGAVEQEALATHGLVATIGRIDVEPGAGNVIAGRCRALLDMRHADDQVREDAMTGVLARAQEIATRRGLSVVCERRLEQAAVKMDRQLVSMLGRACALAGAPLKTLASGAGHDAMVVAGCMPAAMLFLRSPGGLSHHPDESVREEDVALALVVARHFLDELSTNVGLVSSSDVGRAFTARQDQPVRHSPKGDGGPVSHSPKGDG